MDCMGHGRSPQPCLYPIKGNFGCRKAEVYSVWKEREENAVRGREVTGGVAFLWGF